MNKRITSIALFDHESLNKFEKITSRINEHLCKVPYRENDREKLDTLPYHFTFTVWNIEDKDKAMKIIKNLKIDEIKIKIIGVRYGEKKDALLAKFSFRATNYRGRHFVYHAWTGIYL